MHNMQIINEIGILAWATRMRRLYEHIQPEGKAIYQTLGLDFDARWFTLVYALIEREELSVTDLSGLLGLSHPTIIQTLKELEKAGWVESRKSENDGRVRLLRLTEPAQAKVPKLQYAWALIRQAIEAVNQEGQVDFWQGFLEFESALLKKSMYDRVLEIHERKNRKSMMKRPPSHPGAWFDRKFDFSKLNTTPEGLMERLRSTPLRLEALVETLTPAQLTQQFDGKWSVQENIGHLNDLEPLWLGRIEDIAAGAETMRPADLENTKTHEAEHDELPMEKLLLEFKTNRQRLVQACEENYDLLLSASAKHPRLGTPMRMVDLMYFVAEHDDHHIATVRHLVWGM